jgi:hypothetical protein
MGSIATLSYTASYRWYSTAQSSYFLSIILLADNNAYVSAFIVDEPFDR